VGAVKLPCWGREYRAAAASAILFQQAFRLALQDRALRRQTIGRRSPRRMADVTTVRSPQITKPSMKWVGIFCGGAPPTVCVRSAAQGFQGIAINFLQQPLNGFTEQQFMPLVDTLAPNPGYERNQLVRTRSADTGRPLGEGRRKATAFDLHSQSAATWKPPVGWTRPGTSMASSGASVAVQERCWSPRRWAQEKPAARVDDNPPLRRPTRYQVAGSPRCLSAVPEPTLRDIH
jgi:hypothetical protein